MVDPREDGGEVPSKKEKKRLKLDNRNLILGLLLTGVYSLANNGEWMLRARARANTRSTQTRDPFHPRCLHPI